MENEREKRKEKQKYLLKIKKLGEMKNVLVVQEKNINIVVVQYSLKKWIVSPLQ